MNETLKKSPMMIQWYECKKKAKDALLLFRLGDFYEAFYDDAQLLSETADVTLTQRQGVPMSGVPAHAAEGYIEKLVAKGFLVAIAEQVEDAKEAKGLVKRDVVRIVSPGTLLSALSDSDNNFFACLTVLNKTFALAFLDLSTGELRVMEGEGMKEIQDELFRSCPTELLISEKDHAILKEDLNDLTKQFPMRITEREHYHFNHRSAHQILIAHFKTHSLDGFGMQGMTAGAVAAGVLLSYVQDELSLSTVHIKKIVRDDSSSFMVIDKTTQRNLELTAPLHSTGKQFTLLKLLNHTKTPMGARLFKTWITRPLLSLEEIMKRQEGVEELSSYLPLTQALRPIRDLERLMMRIATGSATPRDLIAFKISLQALPSIQKELDSFRSPIFQTLHLPDAASIAEQIARVIVDEPPSKMGDGKVIREGVDEELDELHALKTNSQTWIAKYQGELREITGIKTLKIIFSKGFGYCIEVSRGQADKMPSSFERRQTLVNNERFISPELKAYEEKIFTAEDKIKGIEARIYHALRKEIATHIETIQTISHIIATLDCLLSLAVAAVKNGYVRPHLNSGNEILIEMGRHPVIEASLYDDSFIPNDTHLNQDSRLVLITGPNMAGKSTYIRQVALITIMAQIGSFVPAQKAHLGVVDKVFSRIGASDDLSRGQSTFMLEMTETANILHNATSRSLVILDEIGRGTSTFDGISIAWAVAEHLLKTGAKTLFATHYWELTELEDKHPNVKNIHVAVQETADNIIFLRKMVEGSTDKSYGIHVARLAGLPQSVLRRAHEILHKLEEKDLNAPSPKEEQLSLFSPLAQKDTRLEALRQELQDLDINETSPIEALHKILAWKKGYL